MSSTLLLLLATASALKAPALWRSTLSVPRPALWSDVTCAVESALPAISAGLCHVRAVDAGHSLALIDPAHLAIAPPAVVAPGRRSELCLVLMGSRLIYPAGARLALICEDETALEEVGLELRLEASEQMLSSAPLSPKPAVALAQAALRGALSASGVEADDIQRLEDADEPSSALKVRALHYYVAHCVLVFQPRSERSLAPLLTAYWSSSLAPHAPCCLL